MLLEYNQAVFRLTLRDLFWLVLVVAVFFGGRASVPLTVSWEQERHMIEAVESRERLHEFLKEVGQLGLVRGKDGWYYAKDASEIKLTPQSPPEQPASRKRSRSNSSD